MALPSLLIYLPYMIYLIYGLQSISALICDSLLDTNGDNRIYGEVYKFENVCYYIGSDKVTYVNDACKTWSEYAVYRRYINEHEITNAIQHNGWGFSTTTHLINPIIKVNNVYKWTSFNTPNQYNQNNSEAQDITPDIYRYLVPMDDNENIDDYYAVLYKQSIKFILKTKRSKISCELRGCDIHNEIKCNNHGTCLGDDKRCECDAGYKYPFCDECSYGYNEVRDSLNKLTECVNPNDICNKCQHGVCDLSSSFTCKCYNDKENGYWDGDNCEKCMGYNDIHKGCKIESCRSLLAAGVSFWSCKMTSSHAKPILNMKSGKA
jgi:hypothetical protein